jgi:hypothetical protein
MTRRLFALGILPALLLAVVPLAAHDDYRVIGTITKIKGKQLDVKTKEGKTFSMKMNDYTTVKRDKEKAAVADLRLGLSVVVDARGDTEEDLTVSDIRIVPPMGTSSKKK